GGPRHRMGIRDDGCDLPGGRAPGRRAVAGAPFEDRPTVVGAATGRSGPDLARPVDLLPARLAHVADPELSGDAVEREAPGVAEPDRPDLVQPCSPYVGIRRRRAVVGRRRRVVDVDAEHLSEEAVHVLGAVSRVARASAIAHAALEISAGAEGESAPVVVREGVLARLDPETA